MRAEPECDAVTSLRHLVDACRDTLTACQNDLVKVAAAVLGADGRIFTAVQVRSRNCNHCSVCAEAIALGMAFTAGSTDLAACVALVRTDDGMTVWSPCGSCRELLRDHGVARVVVLDRVLDAEPITATPDELLPWP